MGDKGRFLVKLTVVIFSLVACTVCGKTIIVEADGTGDYQTIQAAINAANGGDIVEIKPGTYMGNGNINIEFKGKAITVCGTDPYDPCVVGATVINCNKNGRGFYFKKNEGPSSVLAGLTITNGYATDGGGIYNIGANPTIKNCIFSGNSANITNGRGGGIYNHNCSPTITNCVFSGNSAYYGGGMYNLRNYSNPLVTNCIFVGNSGAGGGMYNLDGSSPIITNCIFVSNFGDTIGGDRSNAVGGIHNQGGTSIGGCNPIIRSCIFWNNRDGGGTDESAQIAYYAGGSIDIKYCCIQGWTGGLGGTGNFGDNPLLAIDSYHIEANSPCLDMGDPDGTYSGQFDIDSQPRLLGTRVDIGADELTEDPVLRIWPMELEFHSYLSGPNPSSQILTVRNIGGDAVCWNLNEDCLWLEVDPNSGESTGNVNEVVLTVDISGLSKGTYNYELTVMADGVISSPQTAKISLDIYEPVLQFDPAQIEFVAAEGERYPNNQQLYVRNSGSGILDWTIIEDCNWLEVNPLSGESNGEMDVVMLSADIGGLSAGDYNCLLTLIGDYAPNSPQTIPVTLHVSGPYIKNTPSVFEFFGTKNQGNLAQQILSISNGGGETLAWHIIEDCDWLSVTPDVGETTDEVDEVSLRVDINSLVPGKYQSEVTICAEGASNNPQVLVVSLYVYPDGFLHVPEQYSTIQEAIDDCNDGYTIVVAVGSHTGDGNRDIDFKGKTITVRSTDPNDPNVVENTIIDCQGSFSDQHRGFYFHSNEGPNSVVAGLTITNGWAPFETLDFFEESIGGGILCNQSSPTIRNCVIMNNMASASSDIRDYRYGIGAGIYCFDSNTVIENCIIKDNGELPGISGFKFPETYLGGGIYTNGGSVQITDSQILGNSAGWGGGIYGNNLKLLNCNINENSGFSGSAVFLDGDNFILNCTIANNEAFLDGETIRCYNSLIISNSIIWGNTDTELIYGNPIITYSDIQGGWQDDVNNIDIDPCFVNASIGDYHLQSSAGHWDPNSESWIKDNSTSPCIDTGDPNSDWSKELWQHGARINMGAYGGTDQASKSLNEIGNMADFNKDGAVNMVDYVMFSNKLDQPSLPSAEDMNLDGIVDFEDLLLLCDNWLWLE